MWHGLLLLAGLFAWLAPGAALAAWPPAAGRGSCQVDKTANVPATMRDGVILRADVYRPKTDKPVPVILMRTQYGKDGAQVQPSRFQTPDWFASHCYIVVIQDIRGQGASDGVFYEYAHDRDDGNPADPDDDLDHHQRHGHDDDGAQIQTGARRSGAMPGAASAGRDGSGAHGDSDHGPGADLHHTAEVGEALTGQ